MYVMKNILSNKKVVQMLMLHCRRKLGRGTLIKSVFDYRFNSNKHSHVFVRNASFLVVTWSTADLPHVGSPPAPVEAVGR